MKSIPNKRPDLAGYRAEISAAAQPAPVEAVPASRPVPVGIAVFPK